MEKSGTRLWRIDYSGSYTNSNHFICSLENVYVITMLLATVWFGLIGFLDDYIKVFKKNKEGLKGGLKSSDKLELV